MAQEQYPELYPGWTTVRKIGTGSFGAVYEIQRDLFGKIEKAALKYIHIPHSDGEIEELYGNGFDDASITARFKEYLADIVREYSLMVEMKGHTNVVYCDDIRYIQHDDGFGWDIYIKMELLTPMLKMPVQAFSEKQVIRLGMDICRALMLCRDKNIVHRDIKPQNILVSETGDFKLGDFGIAKTVERSTGGTKTGTIPYMAPEVFHNQPYGSRADIYSLGLVMYWLMNERRLPFLPLPPQTPTAKEAEEARIRRLSGEAIPAPKNGSEELKAIVLKACAFRPEDRFQSAEEMLNALRELGQKKPAPQPKPEPKPKPAPQPQPNPVKEDETVVGKPEPKPVRKPEPEPDDETVTEKPVVKPEPNPEPKSQPRSAHGTVCRKCGYQNHAGETICGGCGSSLTDEKPKPPRKKKMWIPVVCLFLVVIAMVCSVVTWGGNLFEDRTEMAEKNDADQTDAGREEEVPIQVEVTDVTLKVWAPLEDQVDENSWLIQVQKAFEEAHPEYNITWDNYVCPEGDAASFIAADPAAGADVFMYANDQLGTLIQAGALTKLSGAYLEQVQTDVSATYLNTVTFTDGGVYGFPVAPNTWFMYYNKSILSEEDVKSLEACLEKGIVVFEVKNSWYLPAFFFAAGGTLFGETGTDASAGINFGGEIGVNATNAVLDLMENPNFKIEGYGEDYGYGNAGLKDGTVAAYFSGSWDYNGLYEALGKNLGAVAAPTVMVNGAPAQLKAYAGSKAVGVNPNAANPEAAMQFAAFLASADSQLLRFQLRNITPAVTALVEHPAVAASIVATAESNTMAFASVAQPTIIEMNPVWGPIGTFGTNIANGVVTKDNVQESVDALDAQLIAGINDGW